MNAARRLRLAVFSFLPAVSLAATIAGVELPALPAPQPVVHTHWGVQVLWQAGHPDFQPR